MTIKTVVSLEVKRYTRVDYSALRARLQKIPTAAIIRLYYSDDALDSINCTTPADVEHRLDELREHLANRLLLDSPALAPFLADARKFNTWSKSLLDYLVQAAEKKQAAPQLQDPVALWFRPRFAAALCDGGAHTLSELKRIVEAAGELWYKSMPRVGPLKAASMVRWFQENPSLGPLTVPRELRSTATLTLHWGSALVPLEQVQAIETGLSGAQGINRNSKFCLISAKDDLAAVQAYLYKFRGQNHTLNAYKRELERFILWCVLTRRTAMSSVMTEECELYKDFLRSVPLTWRGPSAPRSSERWRPFRGPLKPESQRYAVQVIRSFFEWLGKVRYLAGNPWVTVSDPRVDEKETELDIDKALPKDCWERLTVEGGYLDQACLGIDSLEELKDLRSPACRRVQFRLARAAILLMGTSGMRREEACNVTRYKLKPVPGSSLWELNVLGKRKKWRTVFIPDRAVEALKTHWLDRSQSFEDLTEDRALLAPALSSNLPCVQAKHNDLTGQALDLNDRALGRRSRLGFTPMGLHQVVTTALKRIGALGHIPAEDQIILKATTSHALRHTFATHAVAKSMPVDVLQKLLGHVSINTTSIYVRAERTRAIEEVKKFYDVK